MSDYYKSLSDRLLEKTINGVYGGEFSPEKLPPDLYNETLDRLTDGILGGFGPITGDDDAGLMIDFFRNVNVFSAAKTHQQIKDMSEFLFDSDGFKVPFSQFKEKAGSIFGQYNENWLKTEYNTAAGLAQAGRKWKDVERDAEALPLLKFDSASDDRVRDHHRELDGIVKPVGDPFWDKYFPPLDWNCRCSTVQLEEGEEEETDLDDRDPIEDPPKLFAHNPAKSRYIFDENAHPYFKVEDRYKLVKVEGTPIVPPKRKKPKATPSKLPKKIAEKIPTGGFKTRAEVKDFLYSTIEKESGVKIKAWKVAKDLPLESLNRRVDTLTDLFKTYKLDEGINVAASSPTIVFESTKTFYGAIHYKHAWQIDKSLARQRGQGIGFHRMNFGDKSDGAGGRKYVKGATKTRGKSRVDDENLEIATVVHEFAHVIGVDDLKVLGIEGKRQNAINFFNELAEVRQRYYRELMNLPSGSPEYYDLHLGKYSGTNINEFMAEAFTEYKLSSQPSKYAVEVGTLIDNYYKK